MWIVALMRGYGYRPTVVGSLTPRVIFVIEDLAAEPEDDRRPKMRKFLFLSGVFLLTCLYNPKGHMEINEYICFEETFPSFFPSFFLLPIPFVFFLFS